MLAKTSDLTPADFIKKTIGNTLFLYYLYLKSYNIKPTDMLDLVDGILYLDAENFLQRQAYKAAEAKLQRSKQ